MARKRLHKKRPADTRTALPDRGPARLPDAMSKAPQSHVEDLWVFAYGSLMWRPGFDFVERRHAKMIGAHRALCVYSFVHRGTAERPGLVFGLDYGGTCR